MGAATTEIAAVSIKESCLRTVMMPLPDKAFETLAAAKAGFGPLPNYVGGSGLYFFLNNVSGYTITELTIQVENLKTHDHTDYVIRSFPDTPHPMSGGVILGAPVYRDPTQIESLGPGRHEFYSAVDETAPDAKKWGNSFGWRLVAAKGFRD